MSVLNKENYDGKPNYIRKINTRIYYDTQAGACRSSAPSLSHMKLNQPSLKDFVNIPASWPIDFT